MKEIIKKISIILLICFSFFYTEKIINIVNNKSSLMKQLKKESINYNIEPVNAYIEGDTIIPGIKGKKVNIEKSFNNMKEYNHLIEELLIYDGIIPIDTINNNKDKYIIKGNNHKKEVSILLIVDSNNINKINDLKNITLFINHDLITIKNINKYKENEIYSYGNNGKYTKNILDNDSLLIDRLTNNKNKYCLVKKKDSNTLNTCMNYGLNTIYPHVIGGYSNIKNNIINGSIILLNNINDIDDIIKYIKSKGYNIIPLSTLLEE